MQVNANLIFSAFTFLCGIVAFCIIKFNDFSHVEQNLTKLEELLNKQDTKTDKILEKVNENEKAIAVITERTKNKVIRKRKKLSKR